MGGIVFQMEGTSFLSGRGAPLGGIGFDGGGGFKKNCWMGGEASPHAPSTMGNRGRLHAPKK